MSARTLARIALGIACVAGCLAATGPAGAATVTPNTFSDEWDAADNGVCSVREAIESTNDNADFGGCTHSGSYNVDLFGDVVQLPGGTYNLSRPPGPGGVNANGDLANVLGEALNIAAAPGSAATIDGGDHDRVLSNGGFLTISGLTLRNGRVPNGSGGGLFSSGSSVTLVNSTVTDNDAEFGGGIAAESPTGTAAVDIVNVTVSGNRATGSGGGVGASANALIALNSSTVTGNVADTDAVDGGTAGGLFATGSEVPSASSTITFANTIVAGNTDTTGDSEDIGCSNFPPGDIDSLGFSLVGTTVSNCGLLDLTPSDVVNVGVLLGPLASNGGTTQTHALLTGSPGIDAGNPAPPGSGGACPAADQRGTARPQGSRCDIGAYELVPSPPAAAQSTGACVGLQGKPRKRCLCKQKQGKKRKRCLRKLKKGRKM